MPAAASNPRTFTILKVPKDERHNRQLCKSFAPGATPGAKLIRTDYDAGMFFEVSQHTITSIDAWAKFQRMMGGAPHACIIRGEPDGVNPQRARRLQTNFPDVPRSYILFDFDRPTIPRGAAGAEAARRLLPPAFHTAPCWWQRTGSYGVDFEGADSGPWRTRIRLGFLLDKPLTAPQIKYWLREHRQIVDLAIYTSNQINYTANPVFTDGAIDPVLAAGEDRFGTLDIDDALVDEAIVPDEIANHIPTHAGVAVASRPATISGPKHEQLLAEADECDAEKGERHGTVARWAFDAYGCGMDEQEVIDVAARTLERLGRDPKEAGPEAERLLRGAKRKMEDGTLTISQHLNAAGDFAPVDDTTTTAPATLTPAQAAIQAAALVPWWNRLKVSPSNGAYKATLDNAAIVLGNHSSFLSPDGSHILAFDDFRGIPVWTAPPPWWSSRPAAARPVIGELGHPVEESDGVALAVWLGHLDPATGNEGTPISVSKGTAFDAIFHVSRYRTVNPVTAYMDACAEKWDGVSRLDRVLTDVCHAPASKIVACWFRKWMMQAVARAYKPGAKCDGVLILQGGQGAKKSTFFRSLCPFEELFFEGTLDFRNKDSMQDIQGKMIVEMSELSGTKKDVDVIKAYITKQDDSYRSSYDRVSARRPRRVIFCGTTNDEDSLVDTGRRWWIAEIPNSGAAGTRIDLERTRRERDLWWGEAVVRYRKGEEWWLDDADDLTTRAIAKHHGIGLELADEIVAWLSKPADKGGAANPDVVTPMDIWCGPLGRARSAFNNASGRDIARLMAAVDGFYKERVKITPSVAFQAYIRRDSKMDVDKRALKDYLAHHHATSPDAAQPAA